MTSDPKDGLRHALTPSMLLTLLLVGACGEADSDGLRSGAAKVTQPVAPLAAGSWSGLEHPDAAQLSPDQRRVVERLGYPPSFTILFSDEDLAGVASDRRRESWNYPEMLTSFRFVDGRFVGSRPLPPTSGEVVPTRWRPTQFGTGVSWADTRLLAGILFTEELDLSDVELGIPLEGGVLHAADRLIVATIGNQIAAVQGVSLVREGEAR